MGRPRLGKQSHSAASAASRRETSAGGLIWRKAASQVEVVLVKPAGKDYWTLPKGHVEKGESIDQAALREVREETGLTAGKATPLGQVSYIFSVHENPGSPLVRVFKNVHFFLMELRGGDTSAHDSKEIDQVVWVSLDDAIQKATFDNERRLISKAATMISV